MIDTKAVRSRNIAKLASSIGDFGLQPISAACSGCSEQPIAVLVTSRLSVAFLCGECISKLRSELDANQNEPHDAYQGCVERLLEQSECECRQAWLDPQDHPSGILFEQTGWDKTGTHYGSGCLTQAKSGLRPFGGSEKLRLKLISDPRIPSSISDIRCTREMLEAFAEYQRLLDRDLGRPAPTWDENEERWVRR